MILEILSKLVKMGKTSYWCLGHIRPCQGIYWESNLGSFHINADPIFIIIIHFNWDLSIYLNQFQLLQNNNLENKMAVLALKLSSTWGIFQNVLLQQKYLTTRIYINLYNILHSQLNLYIYFFIFIKDKHPLQMCFILEIKYLITTTIQKLLKLQSSIS